MNVYLATDAHYPRKHRQQQWISKSIVYRLQYFRVEAQWTCPQDKTQHITWHPGVNALRFQQQQKIRGRALHGFVHWFYYHVASGGLWCIIDRIRHFYNECTITWRCCHCRYVLKSKYHITNHFCCVTRIPDCCYHVSPIWRPFDVGSPNLMSHQQSVNWFACSPGITKRGYELLSCTLLFKSNGIFFCNVKKW